MLKQNYLEVQKRYRAFWHGEAERVVGEIGILANRRR